jgi:hypothetical protein
VSLNVRADLADAHAASLLHVARPGARFDAPRRCAIARAAQVAYLQGDPAPPWARPYGDAALDIAHRLGRHAGTITEEWYRQVVGTELDPLDWVEVVGVVVAAIPPVAFARAAGLPLPEVPEPIAGDPTGHVADELADAALNWVPVAAPADARAAVVQALTALPDEDENVWRLAAAQYMSDAQMADPGWNRGTLSRPQMELVAGRLSLLRQCFF